MASSRIFLATIPHGRSDVSALIRQSTPTPSGLLAGHLQLRAPFLFGYAKPVPVNFRKLRSPRRDMVLVAAAGPAMNIALAVFAALAFHLVGYLPLTAARWLADNLRNALILNVVLAVFNLFPLPPLDGGRILVRTLTSRRLLVTLWKFAAIRDRCPRAPFGLVVRSLGSVCSRQSQSSEGSISRRIAAGALPPKKPIGVRHAAPDISSRSTSDGPSTARRDGTRRVTSIIPAGRIQNQWAARAGS